MSKKQQAGEKVYVCPCNRSWFPHKDTPLGEEMCPFCEANRRKLQNEKDAARIAELEEQHDRIPKDANGNTIVPGQRYREFVLGPVEDRELVAVMACRYVDDFDAREVHQRWWKKCVPIQDKSNAKQED